jgi:hypothetical protein
VPFAKDEYVIQTLAADRADEPLHEGILPRAVGRGQDFTDPHALDSSAECLPVDAVTITQEVGRGGVVRESVDELLGGPRGGRMLGHVEVDDASTVVGEHDEDEEDAQARGGQSEEVDGDEVANMVGEERSPGLRRGRAPLGEQP